MDRSQKVKLIICGLISVLALWLLSPTLWTLINPDKKDAVPSYMPNTAMNLGLDLQGGVHLVIGVDLDKVITDQLGTYGKYIQDNLKTEAQDLKSKVNLKQQELELIAKDQDDEKVVTDYVQKNYTQALEYVGSSGSTSVFRLSRGQFGQEEYITNQAIEQTIETIRNRIDEFGVAEPIITKLGKEQIMVQFPGATESERLKTIIGQTAKLDFQMVHECTDNNCLGEQQADLEAQIRDAETKGDYSYEKLKKMSDYVARVNQDLKDSLPKDTTVAFEKITDTNVVGKVRLIPYLLSTVDKISGEHIQDAFVSLQQRNGFGPEYPVVSFNMSPAGAPMLGDMTTKFRGYFMAIVLDGVVKSAPVIQSSISKSGIITLGSSSDFNQTQQEAKDLAIVLRAGALPASIELQEERVIGPSVGRDAIEAGKKALAIAAIAIFIFMWLYYGWSGLLANFVTLINAALIFAILGSLGATLTLPGIAGIVLTIGMAVDALIIIFERMREELRRGKNARQIVEQGFDRAYTAILDSNVTTAIGAIILLQYGTGSIRGFALTLLVGIITNVFMATFFTKVIFKLFVNNNTDNIRVGLSKRELQLIKSQA